MKTACADVATRGKSGNVARPFSESLGYGAELWPRRLARAWRAAEFTRRPVCVATEAAGVEFIAENGGGTGVRFEPKPE